MSYQPKLPDRSFWTPRIEDLWTPRGWFTGTKPPKDFRRFPKPVISKNPFWPDMFDLPIEGELVDDFAIQPSKVRPRLYGQTIDIAKKVPFWRKAAGIGGNILKKAGPIGSAMFAADVLSGLFPESESYDNRIENKNFAGNPNMTELNNPFQNIWTSRKNLTSDKPVSELPEMDDSFGTRPGAGRISNDITLPSDNKKPIEDVSKISLTGVNSGLPPYLPFNPSNINRSEVGNGPAPVRKPRIVMGGGKKKSLSSAFAPLTPKTGLDELNDLEMPKIPFVSPELPTLQPWSTDMDKVIGPESFKGIPEQPREKIEPETAMAMYKRLIQQMPIPENYKASIWTKIAASLVGASQGYFKGAGEGYSAARGVVREPYEQAMMDWKNQIDELEPLMEQESRERIKQEELEYRQKRDQLINQSVTLREQNKVLINNADNDTRMAIAQLNADLDAALKAGDNKLAEARLAELARHNKALEAIQFQRNAIYGSRVGNQNRNADARTKIAKERMTGNSDPLINIRRQQMIDKEIETSALVRLQRTIGLGRDEFLEWAAQPENQQAVEEAIRAERIRVMGGAK